MRTLFFLLLLTFSIHSQTIELKGKVINAKTKESVAYASISFFNIDKGVSTRENGEFSIKVRKQFLNEKVIITSLNYKDTIVIAQKLLKNTIELQPKVYKLDEIVISSKKNRQVIIDNFKESNLKALLGSEKSAPWIATKYFKYKNKYAKTPYIKELDLYVSLPLIHKQTKFRIRFFKKDKLTGKPSEDLTSENIVVSKTDGGKIAINVSNFYVEMPKDGLFVGIEWLNIPYNFHNYENQDNNDIQVSPNFGADFTKKDVFIFYQGKWVKRPKQIKNKKGYSPQPLISLTLNN